MKIETWECDVCRRVTPFTNLFPLTLNVDAPHGCSTEEGYKEVCSGCRESLVKAYWAWLDGRRKDS